MIRTIALTLIMLLPGAVYALGLGKLDLRSGLNEPMDARIELLSPSVDELESLKVGLANSDAFARADIDRTLVVTQLRFEVKEVDKGADYIRIYSREAIREPFLNFLLEINWNRGRLFREYTVLLDPPTYAPDLQFQETVPTKSQLRPLPVPEPASSGYQPTSRPANTVIEDGGHTVVHNPEYKPSTAAPAAAYVPNVNYSGGDYSTSAGDTLWSVASGMRPDNSVSIQQMMMALYRANPEAFINNNINGLKRGQILTAPELSDIQSLSKSDAIEDVKNQNNLWDELRGIVASNVEERPESTGVSSGQMDESASDSTASAVEAVSSDPELRLVAADESTDGVGQGSQEMGADSETLSKDLSMAQESLATLEGENSELKDKLVEAESIIDDLKRLIVLKEDELAALQNQMSEQATVQVPEEASEEVVEEVVEEPMVEEAVEEEFVEEEPVAEEEVIEEEFVEDEPMVEEAAEEEFVEEESTDSQMTEADTDNEMVQETSESAGMGGVMEMAQQYIGPAKDFIMENLTLIGGGAGGIVLLLLGFLGFNKWRENRPEVVEFGESDIMDFDDLNDEQPTAADMMDVDDDSEAVTEVPDEDDADVDITPTPQAPDEDKTQIAGFDDTEAGPAAVEEEPEEDPLAEVNVFLAYEHFDQAADFVKSALEDQPDNLDFHTKLLEVYYAANDKNGYEEAAQVLHDKVEGSGDHWDMAVAMWSEMSPNRALFEEREDGLDDTQEMPPGAAESIMGGGIVDLTADEESSDNSSEEKAEPGALDFDIGDTTGEHSIDDSGSDPMEDTLSEASDDDDVLDITSNESDEEILDVTAAENVEEQSDEDLLDVTAAVGLDTDEELSTDSSDEEDVLDVTGSNDEDVLDISAGAEEDLLEMSSSSGEDLLDVTAATNLQAEGEEDLLDVTTASSMGADNSDLLESDTDISADEADDATVDFDVEGLDLDMTGGSEADDDSALDLTGNSVIERAMDDDTDSTEVSLEEDDNTVNFDIETDSGDDGTVELDVDDGSDAVDLDLSVAPEVDSLSDENEDEGEISLDLDSPANDDSTLDVDLAVDDLTLDMEQPGDTEADDLEVDLGEETEDGGIELDLTNEFSLEEENTDSISQDFDLDLEIETEDESASVSDDSEIDMEGTVEMPKIDFVDDDDEDDDEQKTVFVPRSSDSDEQSLEDEVSTKLDLAKAYVELGDNDSAKTILDEIIAEGNDEQKQQAQELMNQVS